LIREGDAFVPCHVLNLSEGGVFVMRKDPLPLGTDVHLRLTFQEMETPLEVSGKVVSVADKTRTRHPRGMGIEFGELDTGTREKLHRYVKDYLSTILGR
jgi:uncharacterized protein (TIGR02266 family)